MHNHSPARCPSRNQTAPYILPILPGKGLGPRAIVCSVSGLALVRDPLPRQRMLGGGYLTEEDEYISGHVVRAPKAALLAGRVPLQTTRRWNLRTPVLLDWIVSMTGSL